MSTSVVCFGLAFSFVVYTPPTSGNLPALLLMFSLFIDSALFFLFSLGTSSAVHQESKLSLEKMKCELPDVTKKRQREFARRFLGSCDVIKIKFGGNNFIEELTPLKCLDHGVDIAVQILLLGRSY